MNSVDSKTRDILPRPTRLPVSATVGRHHMHVIPGSCETFSELVRTNTTNLGG